MYLDWFFYLICGLYFNDSKWSSNEKIEKSWVSIKSPQLGLDIVAIQIDPRMKKWKIINLYRMLSIRSLFRSSMWFADLVFLSLKFVWVLESCLRFLFVSSLEMRNSASVENRKETCCFDVRSRSAEYIWSKSTG